MNSVHEWVLAVESEASCPMLVNADAIVGISGIDVEFGGDIDRRVVDLIQRQGFEV